MHTLAFVWCVTLITPPTTPSCVQAAAVTSKSIEKECQDKLDKTVEKVVENFQSVRTGRAAPSMLDRINADYYGTQTPINQMANITVADAQTLTIQPYDVGAIRAIEAAIMESDLGITPQNDGKLIRLRVPELTADRRKELVKTVSKLGEEGKVAVRNVRRDANKALDKLAKDKENPISEDEKKASAGKIDKITEDAVKKIDKAVTDKSNELTKL